MKRIICLTLSIAFMLLCLAGCSNENMTIENYQWKLSVAMERGSDELVVAVGDRNGQTAYPDAKIIDVTLTATDGELVIEDKTNGATYKGAYRTMQITTDGEDYEIIIEGKNGYATVAPTEYADNTETPTLPLSIGNYDLYFYAINE